MTNETLRSATIVLSQRQQASIFDAVDRSDAVSLAATRYLGPSAGDYYVGLSEIDGDPGTVRALFESSEQVRRYAVEDADGHSFVYAHYRDLDPVDDLISLLYRHDLVVDWPIVHRQRGDAAESRLRVVGTDGGIQRAAADLPAGVEVTVEKLSTVAPASEAAFAGLTERQRSLLRHAVRVGYYDVPRGATHREIAEAFDVAPGTVSERLQRVERRVMEGYVRAFL